MGWEGFPLLLESLEVSVNAFCKSLFTKLISFREYDTKGYSTLPKPAHKVQVNRLRLMAAIDKQKEIRESFPLEDVAGNHLLKLVALGLAALGETVTRQVH